jgi:hypothetical protein
MLRPWFDIGTGYIGYVMNKTTLGGAATEYFGFPCQVSFHRLFHTHHHHPSSVAGSIGQLVATGPSGLSLHSTPPPRCLLLDMNVFRVLVTADIPTSPVLVTLMMEAIHSSETSV